MAMLPMQLYTGMCLYILNILKDKQLDPSKPCHMASLKNSSRAGAKSFMLKTSIDPHNTAILRPSRGVL
jgi:hypothetical protein